MTICVKIKIVTEAIVFPDAVAVPNDRLDNHRTYQKNRNNGWCDRHLVCLKSSPGTCLLKLEKIL